MTTKILEENLDIAIAKVFLPDEVSMDDTATLYAELTHSRFHEVFGFVLPNLPELITFHTSVRVN